MKRDLPRYVVRLKSGKGTALWFKRLHWPTQKFKNQDIGPAFYAEYASILNGTAPKPKAFLVKGLITHYYLSQKFKCLKPRTQRDYIKFLSRIEANAGHVSVKQIERKHIIAWRDQLATSETPHYANYWLRVIRLLLEFGIDVGEIRENPAKGVSEVKYIKTKPRPWPKDKIAAARKARPVNDKTRLLFELLYCTGQRVGDVLSLKWTDIHGDKITVTQGKTNKTLVIPMTGTLKDCLRRADRRGETILTARGKETPWAYRGAAQAMMKLRKEIGAEAFNIHAIRHTVASEIDNAAEGRAITGHTNDKMFEHYAGEARQERLAEKAQKGRK